MKITIPKPCHENWEMMTPEEKGRFCSVCSKTVRDFAGASDQEIIEVFSHSSEDICGNFNASQLNRDLQYSFINSLFTKFAVGFMLTTGGFVSVYAQQNEVHDTLKSDEIKDVVIFPQKQKKLLGSTTVIPGNLIANTQQSEMQAQLSGLMGKGISTVQQDDKAHRKMRIGGASSTLRSTEKPLCVINGKVSSFEELSSMDTKIIKTMNVLKGASATAIYGSKAQNGVIVVTTKKKEKLKK
ncbi:TonB-dependent receptor plug domain-containing protein [Chryseobacterium sp. RP-3-3]|uniref:TonB-dependent receptor plug domain-containing protein n=1 Tax=Chryseobacterium antibioticum TaxID=2728847 RepID=A0A7Y0APU1_9FLAO|nr:TonB-dependent receptor plug domain-containing protein [Chryseobacterium antibioticum]NML71273.1 TonB-dependent receptor plug domain-containing protein [Chryseobacterium antibioticum]